MRIKRLARQRDDLQDINRRLKLDLEEERNRVAANRGVGSQEEIERSVVALAVVLSRLFCGQSTC